MSQYYGAPPANQYGGGAPAQNLQFYPSSYSPGVPPQGAGPQPYGYGAPPPPPGPGGYGGFGGTSGVSGRMGEQGGLRTGWLAAFSTEGYDGEPPLLEELGVNWTHIQMKVSSESHALPVPGALIGTELTLDADCRRSESVCAHRPAHHGRLRPRRTHPLLPPLRHVSAS